MRFLFIVVLAIVLVLVSCSDGTDSGPTTTDSNSTMPANVSFTLLVEPEFVQGAIPGSPTGVLVAIENEAPTDVPVELTAVATGAEVTVTPTAIHEGEMAEVVITAGPGADERMMEFIITGRRGVLEQTETRTITVLPWEDDRGSYAATLLRFFTDWLANNRPDLGITASTGFVGSFIAPQLLVVSHYLFLSEEWEIGLSWHVMIPPDDWAEIYLRPRDELHPTLAFRLTSQDAALSGGEIEIAPATVPAGVTR